MTLRDRQESRQPPSRRTLDDRGNGRGRQRRDPAAAQVDHRVRRSVPRRGRGRPLRGGGAAQQVGSGRDRARRRDAQDGRPDLPQEADAAASDAGGPLHRAGRAGGRRRWRWGPWRSSPSRTGPDADRLAEWSKSFLESIRNAAGQAGCRSARTGRRQQRARHTADVILPERPFRHPGLCVPSIIVVGVSTGGVQAIQQFLPGFPSTPPGIVIVQHMPAEFTAAFAQRLDKDRGSSSRSPRRRHHEAIRCGRALVIPGDAHGLIRARGRAIRVELVDGPPVCRHRPSVEVLFRSAAQAAGPLAARGSS